MAKPINPPKPTKADLEKRLVELEALVVHLIWCTQEMTKDEAKKAWGLP